MRIKAENVENSMEKSGSVIGSRKKSEAKKENRHCFSMTVISSGL